VVSLTPIGTLGYDLAFFKFSPTQDEGEAFTYYTFDYNIAQNQPGDWDILGIRLRRSAQEAVLLDVRLLYIHEEKFEWEEFEAPRDADGRITIKPSTLPVVIAFFEGYLADRWLLNEKRRDRYFHLLTEEQMTQLHFAPWRRNAGRGHDYDYRPGEDVQSPEMMSVISLPIWTSKYGANQVTSLACASFERHRLEDAQFIPPFKVPHWVGSITFDQPALAEFIHLLKERTWERFVSGTSPDLS